MNRDSGGLLIELLIALSVLTVGLLAFCLSFTANCKAQQDLREVDDTRVALQNVVEVLRNSQFGKLYEKFHGATFETPDFGTSGGSPATVSVSCYVDETTLPPEFGPVLDIDGGGGLSSTDCSSTYKLLPIRLSLKYATSQGTQIRELYLVVAGNRDDGEMTLREIADYFQELVNGHPGTPLADKAEDVLAKLQAALYELSEPSDNEAAAGHLEGAVADVQAMVSGGLLDATEGKRIVNQLEGFIAELVSLPPEES